MKKKLVTILCVTTITASMLAGCGSKTAETTAPTETTAVTETAAATEAATTEAASETAAATEAEDDQAAADKVAALIDAIYVQERNENTDEQCKEAKEAWDALTDAQKNWLKAKKLIRITSDVTLVMHPKMIRAMVMRSVKTNSWL